MQWGILKRKVRPAGVPGTGGGQVVLDQLIRLTL